MEGWAYPAVLGRGGGSLMELVELLKQVVEKLGPLVEMGWYGRMKHDPDGEIERVVDSATKIVEKGLLIGRGI